MATSISIKGINYNWYSTPENGEEFTSRFIGTKYGELTVTLIEEHISMGEGDRWFYDIHYSDNSFERIFNPNCVFHESHTN